MFVGYLLTMLTLGIYASWFMCKIAKFFADNMQGQLPDGRTLVYATWLPDNDFDLFTADPDGSAVRRLTDDALEDAEPAWSPDGSRIAFVRRHVSGPPG